MELPKYLLADNSSQPDVVYIVHTAFPRFILNVTNDEVDWLEDFDKSDEEELANQSEKLIEDALSFYDSEMQAFEE